MHILLQRLLDHNLYATRGVLNACRPLTPEQWHERFDIGPGSLHDTLRHIVGAMFRWSDRIRQCEVRPSLEQADSRLSVDELLQAMEGADRELRAAANDAETRLDEEMTVRFSPQSPVLHLTRATALVHVATHGVHHRAQALNMLRRLGVQSLPDIDAIDAELAHVRT